MNPLVLMLLMLLDPQALTAIHLKKWAANASLRERGSADAAGPAATAAAVAGPATWLCHAVSATATAHAAAAAADKFSHELLQQRPLRGGRVPETVQLLPLLPLLPPPPSSLFHMTPPHDHIRFGCSAA